MLFSQDSQLILRHKDILKEKKIFFSGNIQDQLPEYLLASKKIIYFQTYQKKLNTNKVKIIHLYKNLLISQKIIKEYEVLIYYWPKNKNEARFQLFHLLSFFKIGSKIFIIGKKSSGIKSAGEILKKWINLKKVENAKHSILFSGVLLKKPKFKLEDFFNTHVWKNLVIKSLPGVFGYKKIDEGSKLLASTFSKKIYGKILDMGCGSGVLSVSILKNSINSYLTMTDNKESALISSKETLKYNQLSANIILSDLYSNIFKKFNIIISNPPLHNDLKKDFNITKKIITQSVYYLEKKGELRFVTNSCLNYDFYLKKFFKKYSIISRTNKYKVYQANL
ncbi:16S rRNA (guanine(1207)-N(2))-methyltransferase RsmC [Buchnera aphidicola (Melanaphis sacchari)]|uniref:Ribosomal RNA small subunit methyltransferase C n=1 Tax=Buchnera aphidicola (Melanaphis sacchari) TaxID=2173854 RepID=A0A2U8DFF0_9GAMM|nr:16S rRNA (guanine(1207)-N(2))-methyltransferase RsmC [Buchnera aphidicola]AWH90463.1 16S rRNA (guanine(1207)-N(2))-methyltransferase RsmC [Buchnera aphidicola (Melanaphis sacchari)]